MMLCPLCRLALLQMGSLIAYRDDAGQYFTFGICHRCDGRLERLPIRAQQRSLEAAVNTIADHPERYQVLFFPDRFSALAFVKLEAERLRSVPSVTG